jgi:selenocysteine lyase/cysteine desulfurase
MDPADLKELITPQTRIFAFPHVSNLLGDVADVRSIVSMIRAIAPRVKVLCDGVAYAPHRAIDVIRDDVDYYIWSAYKVYGPHFSVMWARSTAIEELPKGINHYFIDYMPAKLELGGVLHESMLLHSYFVHSSAD